MSWSDERVTAALVQELSNAAFPTAHHTDPLLLSPAEIEDLKHIRQELVAAAQLSAPGDVEISQDCDDPEAFWLRQQHFRPVPNVHATDLSYGRFIAEFMAPNQPVLIQGAMTGWRAAREWVDSDGEPNLDALLAAAGPDAPVTVMDTSQQYDGPGTCVDTTLGAYVHWWNAHVHAGGLACSENKLQAWRDDRLHASGWWYLKDWHFVAACPGYHAYDLPGYFTSDWLNEHYDRLAAGHTDHPAPDPSVSTDPAALEGPCCGSACAPPAYSPRSTNQARPQGGVVCADYRFVYVGPRGTWTPCHSDVLRSYSWSGNVTGRKLWLLLPPAHTHLLCDPHLTRTASDFAHPCLHALPPGCGPPKGRVLTAEDARHHFPSLLAAHHHLHTLIQEPGDLLFVPSGWHHTVYNLTSVISINHNWLNAHNINWCWQLVYGTHARGAQSIQDCRSLCTTREEWFQLVQRMVQADCGLSLQGLAHLCAGVAARALQSLADSAAHSSREHISAPVAQQLLDAQRAAAVLEKIAHLVQQELDLLNDKAARQPGALCTADGLVQTVKCGSEEQMVSACRQLAQQCRAELRAWMVLGDITRTTGRE